MSDTFWEQIHSLGYTKSPSLLVNVYDTELNQYSIIKDADDNTYYDETNKRWLESLQELNLYFKVSNDENFYLCNNEITLNGYSQLSDNHTTHVEYNESIISLDSLYRNGYTDHECIPYLIVDGNLVGWYDEDTDLYYDNSEDVKSWSFETPVIKSKTQPVIHTLNLTFDEELNSYTNFVLIDAHVKLMNISIDPI